MATTTIRVSEATREALRELAASTGEPTASTWMTNRWHPRSRARCGSSASTPHGATNRRGGDQLWLYQPTRSTGAVPVL